MALRSAEGGSGGAAGLLVVGSEEGSFLHRGQYSIEIVTAAVMSELAVLSKSRTGGPYRSVQKGG
jgi:hypothetical protein